MPDATVVGGGISGVACAAALAGAGLSVRVRDRGRRLSGRMTSRRLRDTGTAFDGRVVDIGASYFTASAPEFVEVVLDFAHVFGRYWFRWEVEGIDHLPARAQRRRRTAGHRRRRGRWKWAGS